MKPMLLISLMLSAAACQADSTSQTRTGAITVNDTRGTCGASALQHLIGKTRSDVEAMTFDTKDVRIIRPGMMITMDFIESRLNITLDEKNRVTRVHCG